MEILTFGPLMKRSILDRIRNALSLITIVFYLIVFPFCVQLCLQQDRTTSLSTQQILVSFTAVSVCQKEILSVSASVCLSVCLSVCVSLSAFVSPSSFLPF